MAWVTPVTNRTSGARMTYIDMNRISGNVSYLYNYALAHGYEVEGGDVEKTDWTQNDIVSEQLWISIRSVLSAVMEAAGMDAGFSSPTTTVAVNDFENKTLSTYITITEITNYDLLQNNESVQIQTENGVDLEAGIL